MPLYTFNFTSSEGLGESRVFTQTIALHNRPPRGARYYIRQVSATSTDTYANSFKYVNVFIPELMDNDHANFIQYTLNSNGFPQQVPTNPGFRYYLNADSVTLNAFPNLNLGRHHSDEYKLTLILTPYNTVTTLGKLYSYSVVVEWDTQ